MTPLGGAIIGSAVNAGFGLLQQGIGKLYTDYDRQENYKLNEQAAENADTRTRALYNDFYSPQALMKQYKEAGLSPSMMFGGTPGQGGMNGAMASGTGGPQTPFMHANMLEGAQIANLIAQTRKTNAEAATEEGTNQKGKLILKNLSVGINNQNLQGELLSLEGMFKQIDYAIKAETAESEIQYSKYQVQQIEEAIKQIRLDNTISVETQQEKIQIIKNTVLTQQADIMLKKSENSLKKAQINLTQEQAKKVINDVVCDQRIIQIKGNEYELNKQKLEEQVKQWATENGYTHENQQIALKKMILDFVSGSMNTAVKALTI